MRDIINIKNPFTVKNTKYNFDLDANVGDKIKMFGFYKYYFRVDIENKTISPLWQFDESFLDEIIEQAKNAGNEITQESEDVGIWLVGETGEPVNITMPLICYVEATGEKDANEKALPVVKRWEEWFIKMKELNLCNEKKESFTYCVWRWDTNKMDN